MNIAFIARVAASRQRHIYGVLWVYPGHGGAIIRTRPCPVKADINCPSLKPPYLHLMPLRLKIVAKPTTNRLPNPTVTAKTGCTNAQNQCCQPT